MAVNSGQWGSLSWLSLCSLQKKRTVHGGKKRKVPPFYSTNSFSLVLDFVALSFYGWQAQRRALLVGLQWVPPGISSWGQPWQQGATACCGGLEAGERRRTLGKHSCVPSGKYEAVLPCVRALVVALCLELLCCIFEQIAHLFPLYFTSNSCFSWPNTWKRAFWVCLCFAVAQKPTLAEYSNLLLADPCRYWDFLCYFPLVFP